MRRKGKRPVGKDLTLYDRSTYPISPPSQPFAHGNQPLAVVLLLDRTGALVRPVALVLHVCSQPVCVAFPWTAPRTGERRTGGSGGRRPG